VNRERQGRGARDNLGLGAALLPSHPFPFMDSKAVESGRLHAASLTMGNSLAPLGAAVGREIGADGNAGMFGSACCPGGTLRSAGGSIGRADEEAGARTGRDPDAALLMAFRDHRLRLGDRSR
jgi:hypothetical protein